METDKESVHEIASQIRPPTHHIEVHKTTVILRALVQRTALSSHWVPGAMEVIGHDVEHVQGSDDDNETINDKLNLKM